MNGCVCSCLLYTSTSEVNNNTKNELNWNLFNYPSVDGAAEGVDQTAAYAGANSIAITAYSENQEAAFDLATFITSGEYDQKMADAAGQIPADPANTDVYKRQQIHCWTAMP